jgi:hypothetical protein
MRFSFTLLLACTLVLSHTPATWAEEDKLPMTADGRFPEQDFFCDTGVGTYAGLIMLRRQMGDSMFEIEIFLEQKDLKSSIISEEVHQEILLEAFESPRWNTPDNKQQAAEEFRNKWTVSCLRAPR